MPYKDLETRRKYHREYMRAHKQVLSPEQKIRKAEYMKDFTSKKKSELANYQHVRENNNPERKLYRYKKSAETREIEFAISSEQFNELLFKECHYCGVERAWGVDRKDNNKGYLSYNVVPCCKTCNYMKRDLNYRDFLEQVKKIVERLT